jgi:phosphoglycolate phosphatase
LSRERAPHVSGDEHDIELVCLDMAGTTVADEGLVVSAFTSAMSALQVEDAAERERMTAYVLETMGTSKIEVFRALFGDEERARHANAAFEAAYDELLGQGAARPIPGAEEAIAAIRRSGRKVALCTGFSPSTRDRLLAALGWREVADLTLSPADAGRGRPFPDMVLQALLRLEASGVAAVAVAGDTAADMESGRRAGASLVAGVLTGTGTEDRLRAAGATHVLGSVAELPALLGL